MTPAIQDEAGRSIAPPQTELDARPMGPWDTNAAPLVRICAWCPDFDPTTPINVGATHGMCAACAVKALAEARRS